MAQQNVNRKDLLTAFIENQKVTKIEIKEVKMLKGQVAPKHLHPCPVVGYVESGTVLFQVEGEEKKIIKKGEAFYEPRNKTILHFDNASQDESLIFIAFYLVEKNEELIKLLTND